MEQTLGWGFPSQRFAWTLVELLRHALQLGWGEVNREVRALGKVLPLQSALLGLAGALFVGLVAGLILAITAARVSVVQALGCDGTTRTQVVRTIGSLGKG